MGGEWGGRDYGHMAQKKKLDDEARQARADLRARDDEIAELRDKVVALEGELQRLKAKPNRTP
ncbi:MAG: hypothetical protein QOK05_521 [Chloroflexota bacterium]|jgi:predicted  nucleic acid-binding Zn-ribbon protein|nr:hypothetical protein [Chloroflexota bacterium]